MQEKNAAVHYQSYLHLDQILSAQQPLSKEQGQEAHDETLFIIIHQVYELWFKQILHELTSIYTLFDREQVDEHRIALAVSRVQRVNKILQLLIDQIRIMETMTPLDFLDFRGYLFPASGFQSFQFRCLEVMLGLRGGERLHYQQSPYYSVFDAAQQQQLKAWEAGPSLRTLVGEWLERTPFLEWGDFQFLDAYRQAVGQMLDDQAAAIQHSPLLSPDEKKARTRTLEQTHAYYHTLLHEDQYLVQRAEGGFHFSYKAMLAGLFIHLYQEAPILRMPFTFLQELMDMDELLTAWRYRHAQMVLRMLGKKTGTGGSSGHAYLQATAEKHHVFGDLHFLSTLLIPRSALPNLPDHVQQQLGFFYSAQP